MPILNRAAEMQAEIAGWRHHLHQRPELLYDVHETAAFVADKLRAFGCDEVATGIGRTGVVGIIKGARGGGPVIGLRADMDALPIAELGDRAYKSQVPGRMHACGHDGHTAMLLGAARYLAETRNFAGGVAVIFQPAEEGGGGGLAMIRDGLMDRFDIGRVFGMHNLPGMPVGHFGLRPGPIMAATADFAIVVKGRGGHAALPHTTVDPVVAASQMVGALQTIAARSTDPLDPVVVSVTQFHAGDTHNVIPERADLAGTIRILRKETAELARDRMVSICEGIAKAAGADADVRVNFNYPVTVNHREETALAAAVASEIAGPASVDADIPPMMGAEDFSYMLEARPGALVFIGNGATAGWHNPAYDFNDEVIPHGVSYWVRLAETALAA